MLYDLPLEQLKSYKPDRREPPDFTAFWTQTLADARRHPLDARFAPLNTGLKLVEAFDVTFSGFGGQPVKGWLMLPRARAGKLPLVVEYIGYGGGRGFVHDWLLWASAGYAHLVMDTRGQGSSWRVGDTPDVETGGGNAQIPGFMTRGILDPAGYYYRRLFTDAVRAIEAGAAHEAVDRSRVAVTGGSQGGGMSLAAAGLVPEVAVAMPDVPFLCHFRRATEITDSDPYGEIVRYCRSHRDKIESVFRTLAYFDGMSFAARAKARALFSVALMDDISPPSTVFAAYNHYAGPKEIRVWPYNRHEGGEGYQIAEKLKLLAEMWG